jgi:uncharacterized membrane protein YeaQ/YmgE (transglycosylase-associated protein family)
MFTSLLFSLFVGAIAGWIASKLVAGSSLGLLANIVVGMVGAVVAQTVLPFMGFSGGLISSIFQATIGAMILLVLLRVVRRL